MQVCPNDFATTTLCSAFEDFGQFLAALRHMVLYFFVPPAFGLQHPGLALVDRVADLAQQIVRCPTVSVECDKGEIPRRCTCIPDACTGVKLTPLRGDILLDHETHFRSHLDGDGCIRVLPLYRGTRYPAPVGEPVRPRL